MRNKSILVVVVLCVMGLANVASADTFGTGANEFTIDFVNISGDGGDLGSWPAGTNYTFSGVNHGDYRIGTYEITNDQWNKFKASVGGKVTGWPLYAYAESSDFTGTDVPTNELSWYEGAQFVNYLNTSTGHAAAYKFTGTQGTSDYTFASVFPFRNSDAKYFMPTEDEWVKAAYWNGTSLQTFATKAGENLTKGDGTSGTGWNYYDHGYATDPPGPWNVGSGSEELNGTFDMMGNVSEWMESTYSGGYLPPRGMRGGSYYGLNFDDVLSSSYRNFSNPYNENRFVGFRVACIILTAPPIANANGPYTVYVGDTLTLDGSGSTDDDNDIVSYLWDLDDDDDGVFETDAGGQAIFDVNFDELQLLGLLIGHTYTIHLKVTDSEGQSDVNDSTLTILPKPAIQVVVDFKPRSCPNPVNVKSSGILPVAVLGSADVNVLDIDPTSIAFSIGDVSVGAIRCGYEDVAAPVSDANDCNCTEEGPDGFLDLTLKFKTQRIVEAIGDVNDGDVLTLELTGVLFDPMPFETPIEGADCILIRGRHKPINPADINKDGVVNAADFAIFAENWLQSSIVDD